MTTTTTRRAVVASAAAAFAAPTFAAPAQLVAEFDRLWSLLDRKYCFFGEKTVDWVAVRALYRPKALAAADADALQAVLQGMLNELYDAHTHMADAPDGAPRWPWRDLWLLNDRAGAVIESVREASDASAAGLRPGDRLLTIDGLTPAQAVAAHRARCLMRPDPEADRYALNVAGSGRLAQPRRIQVERDGRPLNVDVPVLQREDEPDVSHHRLAEGYGYIRIASFAHETAIAAFDQALAELKDAPGLVLDVRRNGGGDTAVARPIMGRFITRPKVYALMRRRVGQSRVNRSLGGLSHETVAPRGPFTYAGPVVVLTDHWSASMAEGFPMGMRGIGRAKIVGQTMMGLGAAVFSETLPVTGARFQYSAEPVYDVADHPRWKLRPDVETPPGADILAAGVAELKRMK